MSNKNSKFYITTPIYYVNADPHIGSAYTTVAADVLARYHRMIGDDVFFLTGADEHGAKIAKKAKEAGIEPQKFVDEIVAKFKFAWDELNISNDNFIRTTDLKHKKAVQNALQYMYDKGDIYKGEYEGLYCKGCEQYKSEKDLIGGKCPDHNKKPEKTSEECYMFKMSKYSEKILEKIKSDEFKIRPTNRKKEILNFYRDGLKDIAFSRKNVKWGIPLPWDKSHTVYVWADAFLNYITGIGLSGDLKDKLYFKNLTEKWWPANLHLMSKDILRVHATIWPAMLLALDLPLPKELFIHGFFLIDGQKMSKSLGNIIAPSDMVKKYGVDGVRYLLMSATLFGHDGDIGWKKFDEKYNADLANGLGNLVARSITLAEKMRNVGLKMQKSKIKNQNDNSKCKINKLLKYKKKIESVEIDKAIDIIFGEIKFLDNLITTEKPWEMIKNKDENVGEIMYNILERIRIIAWMLLPFMPDTTKKIWTQLGLSPAEEMKKDFNKAVEWGGLSANTKIKKGESLFPRV
ncbi:MAG: methionine--tRNA ligase [Patescibacteria group bacterium]|nr:methionine--tRNA ligase [Patescibacteria group bacterium]